MSPIPAANFRIDIRVTSRLFVECSIRSSVPILARMPSIISSSSTASAMVAAATSTVSMASIPDFSIIED